MRAGWHIKTIGEVCDVVNGGTPKTGVTEYWDGPHQWITPAEMGKRSTPYIQETGRTITDLGLQNSSATPLPVYSVILSSRAPIGHLVINTAPMATNQGCKGLVPSKQVEYKFLYHYLSSIIDLLNDLGTGSTFKELSGGKLKEVKIPVPPLPEQQRIVGILDEAFEGITTAKDNAEKNLQNARALFESHLQALFSQRGDGWKRTIVGDQIALQRGFDITKNAQIEGDVPVVSSGGIKSFHDKAMAQAPGVVIGRKGTLGKVFYLETDFWPHDTTLWIKDFKGNNPRFVYYFFIGLDVKHLDSGTANPALNRNLVHPIEVNWPPVSKQGAIVETLDALSGETQRLESIYQQKLAALDALKKSLLDKAFTGEL
ncbi:MAG: restriction endonuclease subunit S [Desulfuromonadales bacterium]